MDCAKNLFPTMSQDEIKKLDEVLQSEEAKVMLDSNINLPVSDEMSEVNFSPIASDLVGSSDLNNLVLPSPSDPSPYDDESANLVRQIIQDDISKSLGHGFILIEHNYCRNLDFEIPLNVDETACEVTISNTPVENVSSVANLVENESSVKNWTENEPSVKKLAENDSSVTDLADNEPSVKQLAENESSVASLAENKPSAIKFEKNEYSVTNLAENKSSVIKFEKNEYSVTNSAQNKPSGIKFEKNEFSVTELAENEPSVKKLAENESSVANLAENKPSAIKFEKNEYSVTNLAENISSGINFADNESSVIHCAENKSLITDCVEIESLGTDSVEGKSSVPHSVENKSVVLHHVENESLVTHVENQAATTQHVKKSAVTHCIENESFVSGCVENDSTVTHVKSEILAIHADNNSAVTCVENKPLVTQAEISSVVHCLETEPVVTHPENESPSPVVHAVEAVTPRRRSQRQIAKVTREKIEKEKVHNSEEESKLEETVLNNLQQTVHLNPGTSPLLANFKSENIEGNGDNLIKDFGEQVKGSCTMNKRHTASLLKNDVDPHNVQAAMAPIKRGATVQHQNKTTRKENLKDPEDAKEVAKVINSKDIKAIVSRSKFRRKSSELETVDNCITPAKTSTKNMKNIKRRDSTSSASSEMSASPGKSIKGKKSIIKNQSDINGSSLDNISKRASLPSKKLSNAKEVEKNPNGESKLRKKSLSFSEEKNDSSSEKKRHLSSSGKESFSIETPVTKSKTIKPKKRIFKTDSINLDLLGPALFSQPHVMGKQKSEEQPDVKESPNNAPSRDTTRDAILKPEEPGKEENELDLIRAEVKTEQTNSKQVETSSLLEKTLLNVKVKKGSESKMELQKIKSNLSESNLKPIDSSCVIPTSTTMEKEKSKPTTPSGKSETKASIEIIKPAPQATKERKPSSSEKCAEPSPRSSKTSEKQDALTQPERKSQRNVQKRKRIYEDDSDFEESSVVNKKSSFEAPEIESRETVKRNQRQKSIFQIENESRTDDEDDDNKSDDKSVQKINNDVKEIDKESEEESGSTKDDGESSEEEKEVDSDDDPDKLWCICRQPHNNKFMICCDKCEDWFHGTCVGITRKTGQMLENEKKEWICPNCKKGITRVQEKRSTASTKTKKQETTVVAKKAQKQTIATQNNAVQGKQTRQSPKGKTTPENGREAWKDEAKIDSSKPCHAKPSETSNNTKAHILRKIDKGGEAVVLMKRDPRTKKSVQQKQTTLQKAAARKENSPEKVVKSDTPLQKMVVNKGNANSKVQPVNSEKASSSKHTDNKSATPSSNGTRSLAKSNSQSSVSEKSVDRTSKKRTVSVSNDNTSKTKSAKEHGKRKTDCIVCSEPVPPGSVYCNQACLERYTTESLQIILNQKGFLKDNENWKTKRIIVLDRQNNILINGPNAPALGEIVSWLRSNPSFEIVRPHTKKESIQKPEPKPQPLERLDERGESSTEAMRKNVRNALNQTLIDRCKNAEDFKMSEDEIQKIAFKIEEELHNYMKDMSRYMKKYRSLVFNIKDSRNMGLFRKILSGEIAPDCLVKMSTEELAAPELAQWRAMENQHSLDMIKRMQVDRQTSAGVRKKTHKGEIEIEDELAVREPEIDKEIIATPPRPPVETIEVTPEKKENEPEKMEENDTTNSHRSHLFDLNCKICTGKIAPPPLDESLPKKVRVAHSISVEQSSPKSLSSLDKLISPVTHKPTSLLTAVEISDDSADREPTSTTQGSPDSSNLQLQQTSVRKKSQFSVWKGFVAMQDVAKFFTNAYKVSGPTDFLPEDIPDTIQVCGRIVPDQVWDYLSKIKQSGNKELIIIRFQAANEEERAQYNYFYTYLYSRKRYGVVGSSSKMVKDFYIFPLAAHNPVPTVLMPFDGPGLPSQRPHLLLGVLVRHKIRQSVSGTSIEYELEEGMENERSFTPPLETRSYTPPIGARSYTPPLPSETSPDQGEVSSSLPFYNSNKSQLSTPGYIPVVVSSSSLKRIANEEYDPNEPSYTPPRQKMLKLDNIVRKDDDEKPYDPEQDCLSSTSLPRTNQSNLSNTSNSPVIFTQLLKKITNKSGTTTDSLVSDTSDSSSYMQQERLLLDVLTQEVEETDQKVISLKSELEVQVIADQSAQSSTLEDSIVIPSINSSGMSSFLDIPQIQEILNSVQMNTGEQTSSKQSGIKDIDQRCLPEERKTDVDFRCLTQSEKDVDSRQIPSYSPVIHNTFSDELVTDTDDRDSSQGATPPPICEDDNNSSSELRPSDPRIKLRTNFVDSAFPSEETKKISLSDMSTFELMERAQKELETIPTTDSQNDIAPLSVSAEGITLEQYQLKSWAQYAEPPPPGIDPSELPHVENVSFPTSKISSESLYTSQLENHAAVTSFPPQPSPTAAGFPVSLPPPGYPLSTPPPTVDGHKLFPLPATLLPPAFMPPPILPSALVISSIETIDPVDDRYHMWAPDNPPADSDWREIPQRWHDRDWEERPYRRSQQEHRHDHQGDFHRSRFRREFYPDDFAEEIPPRSWQEGDRDPHFERSEHRWNRRPFRDHRRNDNFRGRRNFRRPRD